MSSEISSIDRCTGRFLSRLEMVRPKTRPAADTAIPTRRSEEPLTPRNRTEPRSGRTSSASLARAAGANSEAMRAAEAPTHRVVHLAMYSSRAARVRVLLVWMGNQRPIGLIGQVHSLYGHPCKNRCARGRSRLDDRPPAGRFTG